MSTKKTPLSEAEMEMLEEVAMLRAEGKSWKEVSKKLGTDGERLRKLVRRSGRVYWELFEEAQYRASMEAAARGMIMPADIWLSHTKAPSRKDPCSGQLLRALVAPCERRLFARGQLFFRAP